jgi:hypothetical protein
MMFNSSRLMNDTNIMNSTRQQYTRPETALENTKTNNPKTISSIKISKVPHKDLNSPATKGNKRALIDTSNNQSYMPALGNNDEDEDEDDALLTQALNEQEAKNCDSQTPPAKKPKSLVLSLFDDEEDQDMTLHLDEDSGQSITKNVKKISFAALLEDSQEEDEALAHEKEEVDKKSNSIYIDETSSEEEND